MEPRRDLRHQLDEALEQFGPDVRDELQSTGVRGGARARTQAIPFPLQSSLLHFPPMEGLLELCT